MKCMMTTMLVPVLLGVPAQADEKIPRRPEELTYQPLQFEPPAASDFRHELKNGVPVYLAPSREFPLITVEFSFRGGSYLDPADKVGLADMAGAMIRRGGTAARSAEDLDEEFDFLAAQVSTSADSASLNCLSTTFDAAFALFLEMLREPGFEADKQKVHRDQVLESLKQRNDNVARLAGREWGFLMYGEDSPAGREPTQQSILAIEDADLRAYHARVFQPGNLIILASGDFDPAAMRERLESALEGWTAGERMPPPPPPTKDLLPGVYHAEKDIPQGRVILGHRSVDRDHPDYFPLLVMNDILGGGGFTSRITSRVRSDEGLAYSAGSGLSMPPYYPGEFRASFQSKNRTVALAIQVILEEIEKIRTEPVSQEELDTSRNQFIETFPQVFDSPQQTLSVFVEDEWTGRPEGYWQSYRDRIRAVTPEDVLRVAKEHLHPDEMAILVAGKWEEIAPGDLEGRASMKQFHDGEVTHLPARDPLTLQPQADG